MMKKILLMTILLVNFNIFAVLGPIPIYLNPIPINSNAFLGLDTNATFASEIYNTDDIKKSNAKDIYDFLSQNTSVVSLPNFGNTFFQSIGMRGFGLANGNDNVVMTLNGRRLNNIDGLKQFLANIDINTVKKIAITKGSGSVVYGDGATAGSIHITSKETTDGYLNLSAGNYGYKNIAFNKGFGNDKFSIILSGNKNKSDGYSEPDGNGNRTKSDNKNTKITFVASVSEDTKFVLGKSKSNVDFYYPDIITLEQFNTNPGQYPQRIFFANIVNYRQQKYNENYVYLVIKHKINQYFDVKVDYSTANKDNEIFSLLDYKNKQTGLILNYNTSPLSINIGYTKLDGRRHSPKQFNAVANKTTKQNNGIFIKGLYKTKKQSFSLGFRQENIDYQYSPATNTITVLTQNNKLNAFDIGVNHTINDKLSLFVNYNQGFQTPNIDNFFTLNASNTAQIFNTFIKPAKIKTFNIGLNYLTNKTKTKLTVFRSNLTDEIYYYDTVGFDNDKNTNIDKSHKYGLELQHKHKINDKLNINSNYAYIIAKIDEETQNGSTYDGNDLPGVSKHNITLGINYKINDKSNVNITQKYRSSAYSSGDFDNNRTQKQKAFKSTDVAYKYQYSKTLELLAKVQNLFENKNGVWVGDDQIYPTHFSRIINLGLNYQF